MPSPQNKRISKTSTPPKSVRILIPLILMIVWLAIGAAGGNSFSEINDVASNDRTDQLPSSAESTQVAELQHQFRESDAIPAIKIGRASCRERVQAVEVARSGLEVCE